MAKSKSNDIQFNMVDKYTIDRLRKDGEVKLPRKNVDIPKDMQWNMKTFGSKLLQGLENGDSVEKIARSILPEIMSKTDFTGKTQKEIYGKGGIIDKNVNSAISNARTMVTSAENHGRLDSYKDLSKQGVVMKKKWMSTPDGRTRVSHMHIDSEEQDIDDLFSNDCMYPGDSGGPPEEVWNCRCSMTTHIIGFKRVDGSVSYVQYSQDKTTHDEQMAEEKTRRATETKSVFKLVGGNGDAEITDNIHDYYLPSSVRDKLDEYEHMKTYNEFKDYFKKHGIILDTDLNLLKGDRANDEIEPVNNLLRKIAVGVDTYKETFGEDTLNALTKITLYSEDLDTRAAYFFNLIGEKDPLAGTIEFRDWSVSGRDVFHELAHAMQDSIKDKGEDVIIFADRIAKELDIPSTAYRGSSGLGEDNAEMMAEVLAFGFIQGKAKNIEFIEELRRFLRRRNQWQ